MYQNEALLERAMNLSLANNFVTDLTSLVVVIEPERRSQPPTNRYVGSGVGGPWTDSFDMSSFISPEDNSVANSPCNITLYSDEVHQGESLTFSDSVPDISFWDFEEALVSVKVEGTCSWKIFTGDTLSLSVCPSLRVDVFR